jgi:deazaflavin-dependent oxidoreductase (nitroreductase family)
MAQSRQTGSGEEMGALKRLSRWWLHKSNARMAAKVRKGRGSMLGMNVLILHTVGRRSGQPYETPVAWFADGEDTRLIVASGGNDDRHPDWYENLMAHADQAKMELAGSVPVPVTPQRLDGTERERAWKIITGAQPRIGRYQSKSKREYPIVRLTPR